MTDDRRTVKVAETAVMLGALVVDVLDDRDGDWKLMDFLSQTATMIAWASVELEELADLLGGWEHAPTDMESMLMAVAGDIVEQMKERLVDVELESRQLVRNVWAAERRKADRRGRVKA